MITVQKVNRDWLRADITGSGRSFWDGINLIKELPVRSFKNELNRKYWIFPLRDLQEVQEACGDKNVPLIVADKIVRDYKNWLEFARFQISLRHRNPLTEIPLDFNILKLPLFDFQILSAWFAHNVRGALIGHPVGIGKTVIALAVNERRFLDQDINFSIVSCPATLKQNWKREIEKFTNRSYIIIKGNRSKRKKLYKNAYKFDYMIINYDLYRHDWELIKEYILERHFIFSNVFDECQYLKNPRALRTRYSRKLSAEAKYDSGLSATAFEKSAIDLQSIYQLLDDTAFSSSILQFADRYLDTDFFGKPTGTRNIKDIRLRMTPTFIRYKKEDVLDELPEIIDNNFFIELSATQRKLYNEVANRIVDSIQDEEKAHKILVADILPMMIYLRQCACSALLVGHKENVSTKTQKLIEFIDNYMDLDHDKMIIFCTFVPMIEELGRVLTDLGHRNIAIHAKNCPIDDRIPIVEEFDNSPDMPFLVSSNILQEGVNAPHVNYVMNFDILFNPAKMIQRYGRADRLDSVHETINIINMVAEDTVEEDVFDIYLKAREAGEEILDNGVTESRMTVKFIRNLFDVTNGSK